jgi:hypothetical protein
MTKRLAVGIATVAIALSGFSAATAVAEPEPAPAPPPGPTTTAPAPPGTDVESMISRCTEPLGGDQRGPSAESMRQMMAENMTGAAMGSGAMGEG